MEEDRLSQDVRILREWYEKQPHLPKGINENYFETFALCCKSLEIAKRKLDAFFSQRNDQIWFYDFERLFQRFKDEKGGDFFPLPGTTPEGCRVLAASYAKVDINTTDPQLEMFRRMLTVELLIHLYPRDTKIFCVFDFKNGGVKFFSSLDFSSEINVFKFMQSALPFKFKGALIMNSLPIVEKTLNFFRPFLMKKLFDRIHVISDTSKLAKTLPLSMIPKEYGGEAGSVEDLGARWRKEMLAHEDWFRENSRLRSDESKRPKDSAQSLDCGTFRTLSID